MSFIKCNHHFDGSDTAVKETESVLKSWYLAGLNTSRNQDILNSMEKIIKDLEYPFIGGVINLAVNIYENDTISEKKAAWSDIRSNIAFLKGDDEHILFIAFGDTFADILRDLIKNDTEFTDKYSLENFGY